MVKVGPSVGAICARDEEAKKTKKGKERHLFIRRDHPHRGMEINFAW